MTGWIVLGCVLLALFLLSRVRLGGRAEYSEEGFFAWVRIGAFYLRIFPPEEKKKKQPKEKKKPLEEPPAHKQGGSVAQLKELLPLILDAAGRALRSIRVDRLYLDFTSAGEDPAEAAMAFGCANAAVGMIFPLLEQNFNIKERRIRTRVDFQQKEPSVYLLAQLSMTVGQIIALAAAVGIRFLKHLLTREKKAPAKDAEGRQKMAPEKARENNQKEAV